MGADKLAPVHPGEVPPEEFLKPLGLSQHRLARDQSVPATRINEIVHGKRAVTADTALRLAQFSSSSAAFWLNLQQGYDLDAASDELGDRLEQEARPYAGSSQS